MNTEHGVLADAAFEELGEIAAQSLHKRITILEDQVLGDWFPDAA